MMSMAIIKHGSPKSSTLEPIILFHQVLVPIRIPSNLKHVEMYREAAREMRSLPEYRNDYVFVEYLIHLMIQEVSCDNMLQSIVIQVTLCSTG